MRRLFSCVGFLLLLSGCGRGVSDPAGGASGPSAAQPSAPRHTGGGPTGQDQREPVEARSLRPL